MSENIDTLLPFIYDDLKRLARLQRKRIFSKKNMGTRSIVHQAYINIINNNTGIENKQQFLYLASVAMRNIIIDNARSWNAKKRGSNQFDLPLEQISLASVQKNQELLDLDEALIELKHKNKRMVDIVTCRFFGGLTHAEISQTLGISQATIKRDWTLAKALLFQKLS